MSKTYTTIQGDMWDSIAFSQLGSEAYTDRLMNLNPQYLGYYTPNWAFTELLSVMRLT